MRRVCVPIEKPPAVFVCTTRRRDGPARNVCPVTSPVRSSVIASGEKVRPDRRTEIVRRPGASAILNSPLRSVVTPATSGEVMLASGTPQVPYASPVFGLVVL